MKIKTTCKHCDKEFTYTFTRKRTVCDSCKRHYVKRLSQRGPYRGFDSYYSYVYHKYQKHDVK